MLPLRVAQRRNLAIFSNKTGFLSTKNCYKVSSAIVQTIHSPFAHMLAENVTLQPKARFPAIRNATERNKPCLNATHAFSLLPTKLGSL